MRAGIQGELASVLSMIPRNNDSRQGWRTQVESRHQEVENPRPLKTLENKLRAKEISLQRGMEE